VNKKLVLSINVLLIYRVYYLKFTFQLNLRMRIQITEEIKHIYSMIYTGVDSRIYSQRNRLLNWGVVIFA